MPVDCRVCTNPKGVFRYYGASVCAPCKVFFLRAVQHGDKYVCQRDGHCPVTPERWTKICRACRFQKCLAVKMDPKAVGISRSKEKLKRINSTELTTTTKMIKREILDDDTPCISEDFFSIPSPPDLLDMESQALTLTTKQRQPKIEILLPSTAIGFDFLNFLKGDNFPEIVSKLVELENKCYADTQPFFEDSTVLNDNLDVPLHVAMNDPLRLGMRTPLDWLSHEQLLPSMVDAIKRQYCRLTVYYIDWLRAIPDLQMMTQSDQMKIISTQLCKILLTTMMYQTYKSKSPGIAFSCGRHYIAGENKKAGVGHEFDYFLDRLAQYGHEKVISVFRDTNITIDEFCLLKMIAFWSGGFQITDDGMAIVRSARHRYEQILVSHINEKYPYLTKEGRAMRLQKLIGLQPCFETMGIFDNTYVQRMIMMDIGGFRAQITYDVHLREY
ncbi:unnamed protein product, partial [Mesorhabditis belari]|uniref:Uncharacterized protein n=1 Tax=Mesorhabditis belari TaxID=2138241 RepID=A0AAF3EQS1_9BILA